MIFAKEEQYLQITLNAAVKFYPTNTYSNTVIKSLTTCLPKYSNGFYKFRQVFDNHLFSYLVKHLVLPLYTD